METGGQEEKSREELLIYLRKRLDWYTLEAQDEEFNADEVEALVKLQKTLENRETEEEYDPGEGWKRFQKFYRMRQEMEAAGFAFPDTAARFRNEEKARGPQAEDMERGAVLAGFVRIAAALLAALAIIGGAGVYAEKRGGFFHWLKRNEKEIEFVTSPDNNILENQENKVKYYSVDDIPEEYKKYIWFPTAEYGNWKLESADILKLNTMEKIRSSFSGAEGTHIALEVVLYLNHVTFSQISFKEGRLIEGDPEDAESIQIYEGKNGSEAEYAAYYFKNNIQYIINGNIPLKDLKALAKGYINSVS